MNTLWILYRKPFLPSIDVTNTLYGLESGESVFEALDDPQTLFSTMSDSLTRHHNVFEGHLTVLVYKESRFISLIEGDETEIMVAILDSIHEGHFHVFLKRCEI